MESRERYHELCRLCASYDAIKMDIFGQEGKNRQLVDKIQTCLPFKIDEDDRLPKCLCYRCMYNLENFYDFRTACVNAVALLERCLPPSETVNDNVNSNNKSCSELLKEKESMPVLIPEAPIVNPNAALGTPPRLCSDGEVDNEIEEILHNSGTEEGMDEVDERNSDEYEMDMEMNPSDFLEMTSIVTGENEENESKATLVSPRESGVFQHTSEQHEVYVCSLCNKAFSSKGHLSLHARIHVGAGDVIGEKVITDDHTSYKRPYQCDLCNKSYSTAKHRWGHVSTTHRGHPAVTCGYCSRIYSTRTNLEEHVKSRHAGLPALPDVPISFTRLDNKFQCKNCPKMYTNITDLNKHIRVCAAVDQQNESISKNLQRSKEMPEMSDLSSMDSDGDNKDYKSAEAKLSKNPQLTILKQALTKGISIRHDLEEKRKITKAHNLAKTDYSDENDPSKIWYCEICQQNFFSFASFQKHEALHNGDKSFTCILCKKEFTLKSSLSRHILTYHGVDPSPILESLLKKSLDHSWSENKELTVFKESECPIAETSVSPEVQLKTEDEDSRSNHENMIEIETVFVCEICTRDFNDRASLWLHIRATHKEFAAFACGVCLKICSDNAQLLNHVNMYHGGSKLLVSEQRRYSCTICGRQHDSRKKLIAHVSIHNVDPRYDPASFVQLNSSYYNETVNNVEGGDQIDFDGEEGDKVDCHICYKSFPNEDHLIRHQRNAHKSEQITMGGDCSGNSNSLNTNGSGNKAQYHLFFVCELCGSSHPSKWERWLHVSSMHSQEPSIKCDRDDCGKIFATKSLRNDHLQHHVIQGVSPNTCEICGKLWGSRVDYWKHVMGVHSDTVPLICGVCLKVFPDVIQLSSHVKTKHWPLTNGDFSCDICGRPYSNKSKMSRHRKIHGLEVNGYENNSINETFNESAKVDPAGPVNDAELSCGLCVNMIFSSLDDLCNHRRLAHGLFPCDLCNKCYGRTSHLWKHVNRVHKGHEDVTCRFCLKTSASKDHLAAHIAKIHRYEPEVRKNTKESTKFKVTKTEDGFLHYCEKCNKGFHKRYLLRRHIKGCQNYRKDPGALLTRCRACERIFKDRASLQKHIENHHSTYTCHLCNETITSKLGIMTHNRIKHMNHPDLTCDHSGCNKLFRTKEDLESHRKDHKYHNNPNVCDFCGDTVENKLKLKMHVLSLHRNEIGVSCGVCLIPMKDPKDLKKHVADVHGSILSNPNTCQVCGKQYASKWKAFDHTKKCHGKVFRTCKQCLAVFTNDADIRQHYEQVHNVPNDQLAAFEYRMDIGSKNESYDGGDAQDNIDTPGAPQVVVKQEPEDFVYDENPCDESSNQAVKHKRSILDTYDCEICPEIFLNYSTLTEHYQNVHNTDPARMFKKRKLDNNSTKRKMRNRKNFECKSCQKQFCTKTLFWNHINNCTKRNVYNKDTHNSVTSILETHLKNNNQIKKEEDVSMNETNLNIPDFNLFEDINMQLAGQKPVPNLVALPHVKSSTGVKCSRKDSRKVYDESTNTECACEVCGKQWPAKKHLWQHLIRFHRAEAAVTCGVCLKLCKNYEHLADHLKASHAAILSCEGNNFTCKTCGRYHNARSKLVLHMSIHINYNGNYWCQTCQKSYDNEDRFSEHLKSCTGKLAMMKDTIESIAKPDNDEKGSLIGDGEDMAEVEEEIEDFESQADVDADGEGEGEREGDADTQEDSDSENSEDSDSNSSSSDDSEEEEGDNSRSEADPEESRSNSRATGEVMCNSDSDSDFENEKKTLSGTEERTMDSECSNIIEARVSPQRAKSSEEISVKVEKSDSELSDDEGPPVLSPMMPLLMGDESQGCEIKTKHRLSPMVTLNKHSQKYVEDGKESSAPESDFGNERNNEENFDNNRMEVLEENDDCDSMNRYERIDKENLDDEENSFDGNLEESIDRSNEIEIHNLDGRVLMVSNDDDGNQILIEQNLLVSNEDSIAEAEYGYHEENEDEDEYIEKQDSNDEYREYNQNSENSTASSEEEEDETDGVSDDENTSAKIDESIT
ncbi:zinc finger protein 729-like [Prorops nasuta]|uniref:zinc finger protein 729-like n=1 Tax=Prorops nasuta TaxID=863751 RepID=UPI0034CEE362